MTLQNTDNFYQEELQYNYKRIMVLSILFFMTAGFYFLYNQRDYPSDRILESIFWIMAIGTVSLLNFSLLNLYETSFVLMRRLIPVVLDLVLLTHMLIIWGHQGIPLLIFYVLIVMHTGITFGKKYFYISMIFSLISWAVLLYFSPYWQEHYGYLATYATTTFLIPFFYLDYITQIHQERHTLSRTLENISHEAMTDPLTGVYNRKSYEEICKEFIEAEEPFSLLYIDLNRFKKINDTRGHHIGDMILKGVTDKLKRLLTEHDIIARIGGDEFVVLVSRRYHNVQELVDKISREVIGTYIIDNETLHVSLSIGISNYPENGQDRITLAECADKAMYHAKNTVGRYYFFYDEIKNKENAPE